MNDWISVKDRLPENDNPILVYNKNAYNGMGCRGKVQFYINGKSFLEGRFVPREFLANQFISMSNNGTDILSSITHWMPLPEPPKEA